MKSPKTCIFCACRGKISKEHFWPEWLALHIPVAEPYAHINEFHTAEGKMPAKLERRSERQGGVNTKKIRAVCVNCNNRWMSSLESKVKPTLLDLFGSHDGELTPEAAQTLALWIAVKSIVAEHAAPGTTLTPASDRNAVFRTHAIPNYFQIYIGYHTLQTQAAYHRQSTTVSLSLRGPDPPLTLECTRNIQATLFLVGPLCIYLAAARVAGFDFTTLAPPYPMLMLFPQVPLETRLRSFPPLGTIEMFMVGKSLDRLIAHPNTKYGGPLPPQTSSAT